MPHVLTGDFWGQWREEPLVGNRLSCNAPTVEAGSVELFHENQRRHGDLRIYRVHHTRCGNFGYSRAVEGHAEQMVPILYNGGENDLFPIWRKGEPVNPSVQVGELPLHSTVPGQ